ncbi:MAG: hypothetical protein AAFZ07_01100 [Actinomycetota bacterium]
MALANKTLVKAQKLVGEQIQGYFIAARVHPLAAFLPTFILMFAFVTQQFALQVAATVLMVIALFLTLGRSVAITSSEIVVMHGRPPLWRPSKVVKRLPRTLVPVEKKRLYWKVSIDGEDLWANRAFTDQINIISETPLDGASTTPGDGAGGPSKSDQAARPEAARRERQVVQSTKRVTPKGTRNRKPHKYRR